MSYNGITPIPKHIAELKGSIPDAEWERLYKRAYYEANRKQYSDTALRWRKKSEANMQKAIECSKRYMEKRSSERRQKSFESLRALYPQYNFNSFSCHPSHYWIANGKFHSAVIQTRLASHRTIVIKGHKTYRFKHISEVKKFLEGTQ